MPKLTKSAVARHLGVSRQTLYEWIAKGRISVEDGGLIDSSEVVRLTAQTVKPDVAMPDMTGQELTPQGDSQPDTFRELVDTLKTQLAEAQARERLLLTQIDRLTEILDTRLLQAPPPPTPPEASAPSPAPASPGTLGRVRRLARKIWGRVRRP